MATPPQKKLGERRSGDRHPLIDPTAGHPACPPYRAHGQPPLSWLSPGGGKSTRQTAPLGLTLPSGLSLTASPGPPPPAQPRTVYTLRGVSTAHSGFVLGEEQDSGTGTGSFCDIERIIPNTNLTWVRTSFWGHGHGSHPFRPWLAPVPAMCHANTGRAGERETGRRAVQHAHAHMLVGC